MRHPSRQYAALFMQSLAGTTPSNLDALTYAFVALVAREHALGRLGEIMRLILREIDRLAGGEELVVTTAVPCSASVLAGIQRVATAFGFATVRTAVDVSIGGGAIIQAGDRRVDGSREGALNRLYETLVSH